MELGFRKAKDYFDTAVHPAHVTFDDGKTMRRNLSWIHYIETQWDYADPEMLRIRFGDYVVIVGGRRLGSLFRAIEEQTLLRVRAIPEYDGAKEHEIDSFAVMIRFEKAQAKHPFAATPQLPQQGTLDLG